MKTNAGYIVAAAFVALIFGTIVYVTAILPADTFRPKATSSAIDYDVEPEIVKKGRDIYRREGCFYCHSQFVRTQDWEMGEMVSAGDYVNETPHVLGSERTGPDLSNIGGKYPDAWHWTHHTNPRIVKPGSIMPSYSYLSDEDMTALIAYLQTIGRDRKPPRWIAAPQEYRDKFHLVSEAVDVNASSAANAGRGIYMQNCAQCHGVKGQGNGPVSITMQKKPANFTRAFYAGYDDATWYWRVAEGVPGTRMPKWQRTLADEDMAYLVAFLKTLPQEAGENTVQNMDSVDRPQELNRNFWEIEDNKEAMEKYANETFDTERQQLSLAPVAVKEAK